MKRIFTKGKLVLLSSFAVLVTITGILMSSSHREAPLIANDPLADNTDLYVYRDPYNYEKIVILANYIPAQLPGAGPNYYHFGENIRYEIHIKNNAATQGDDITYRFTFKKEDQDPTTFFAIRLGKENQKTTYTLEKKMAGGDWQTIVANGIVPPPNIGPRSISSAVGLKAPDYNSLVKKAVMTASSGEKVFAGTVDDPFFVDLGGIFDLGDAPRTTGTRSEDFLKCKNVSTIGLLIDIPMLQKDHKPSTDAKGILDGDYVIGVWASASRRKIKVLNANGDGKESYDGDWVQVSRLGMPLTNEAVIPIGYKDLWNSLTPYEDLSRLKDFGNFFYNPELALYMDDALFGGAVPALKPLRIQKKSLGQFGFGNGQDGLYGLKGNKALAGTALDDAAFGKLLLPAAKSPRSVDLWPIFNTGVPNVPPYQLATGKNGNPLAKGKPFINNFLPTGGDMLRLNMAVPPTPRTSPDFSPLGLVQAAVLGLTDPRYNKNRVQQLIPNMDGFPNGRRLEDDVTRIELQAVSGVVLSAIGLWYDDYIPGTSPSPVTPDLLSVLTYSTGIDRNDTSFKKTFPYMQNPWAGTTNCPCEMDQSMPSSRVNTQVNLAAPESELGLSSPEVMLTTSPNPSSKSNSVRYYVAERARVQIIVYDAAGKPLKTLVDKTQDAGTYTVQWNMDGLARGTYFISANKNGKLANTATLIKN